MGRKVKAGPAPTWPLPSGSGQGPRPHPDPTQYKDFKGKLARKKSDAAFKKVFKA